jgi:DNA-directed RNA polymerase specialized sigma24 family protein
MRTNAMELSILNVVEPLSEGALPVSDDLLGAGRCRTTRWSLVLAAAAEGDAARSALGKLYRAYYRTVFSAIARRRGSLAANELTQDFFVKRLVDSGDLKRVQRRPGQRFRSWLLTAVHSFLNSQWTFERRQCRDVRRTLVLGTDGDDDVAQTAALLAARPDPEQQLQRARVLALLSDVLGRLRRDYCKSASAAGVDAGRRFDAVKIYLPGPDTETADYSDCAAALGMTPDTVKQLVKRLRRRFGQLLLDDIRRSVESDADVSAAKRLLCQALEAPATPDPRPGGG